ncbi:hypothetical protein C8J56DRAFT_900150 [Mycena floridula]|nr:hypothetical protein C8J56DRAFT_900150 [Mycena floridula]
MARKYSGTPMNSSGDSTGNQFFFLICPIDSSGGMLTPTSRWWSPKNAGGRRLFINPNQRKFAKQGEPQYGLQDEADMDLIGNLPWEIDRTFWIPGLWSGTTAKSSSMMTRTLTLELLYCGKFHRETKTEPAADRSDKWHPNKEPLVTHLQAWLGPVNEADPLGSSSTRAPSGPSSASATAGESAMTGESAKTSTGNGGPLRIKFRRGFRRGVEDFPRLKNTTRTGWDMDPFVVVSFGKKVFGTSVSRHSREVGGWVQDPTINPRLGHTSMLGRGGWVVRKSFSDMYGWV